MGIYWLAHSHTCGDRDYDYNNVRFVHCHLCRTLHNRDVFCTPYYGNSKRSDSWLVSRPFDLISNEFICKENWYLRAVFSRILRGTMATCVCVRFA